MWPWIAHIGEVANIFILAHSGKPSFCLLTLALVMGYEYGFVFSLPLQTSQLEELLHYLKIAHPCLLLSAAPEDTREVMCYAYAASGSGPLNWDEDFLVAVASRQIYLLLHTVTADQKVRVLTWLQQSAAKLGLSGSLVKL